jgi:hypothetical protein
MFKLSTKVNSIGFNIIFSGMLYFVQSDRICKILFIFFQYKINIDDYNNKNKIVLLGTF